MQLSLSYSLGKQLTFYDAITCFPQNDVWEMIAVIPYWWMHHYLDLGNAFDWLKQIFSQSEVTDSQNTRDQIMSDRRSKRKWSVHSFLVEVKSNWMLATYMRQMHNNNLEIRIAGSSCHLQLYFL